MTDKLTLVALHALLAVHDAEGESSVSWYRDDMEWREIVENLLEDPETRAERCLLLQCTSQLL